MPKHSTLRGVQRWKGRQGGPSGLFFFQQSIDHYLSKRVDLFHRQEGENILDGLNRSDVLIKRACGKASTFFFKRGPSLLGVSYKYSFFRKGVKKSKIIASN
jgi:hypothetical protein